MAKANPQYPIINHEDMVSRDQIRIVPEEQLVLFDRAELSQLRRGEVTYQFIIADTPENRRIIAVKTTYFQMVAYKEGWKFDPERYKVEFVHPQNPLLSESGTNKRIYKFKKGARPDKVHPSFRLSDDDQVGFVFQESDKDAVIRMEDDETDSLADRTKRYFSRR